MRYSYPCLNTNICHPNTIRLYPGLYFIECYGAQGGKGIINKNPTFPGGNGAYTSGTLLVNQTLTLYLYIGGKGSDATNSDEPILGGWNGGGNGKHETGGDLNPDHSAAGGGSTDIRLINGPWNDSKSLRSRIMVAAGGSGSAYNTYGAPDGDTTGFIINQYQSQEFIPSDTTQTTGYKFGIGQDGEDYSSQSGFAVPFSGGGGGYYGGSTRYPLETENKGYNAVSSSGSSYISGYIGCNSISEDGVHLDSPYHPSGVFFKNPVMKNGLSSFPSIDDSQNITGNEGNGAVKITILWRCPFCTYKKFYPSLSLSCFIIIFSFS